jgi:hypothetical protein
MLYLQVSAAIKVKASVIVVFTATGQTARYLLSSMQLFHFLWMIRTVESERLLRNPYSFHLTIDTASLL